MVLTMLDHNFDRFAFSLEDIEPFTGEPIRTDLNLDKPIFRPPRKQGQVEWDFVGTPCKKLEGLGFIKRSIESVYALATALMRKKDEEVNYTDFSEREDY